MPANSTAVPPKRGRRKLSPNGIDQECRQADQARRGKQQKPSGSRVKTELAKRRADRLARALRKQLRRHQLKAPVGSTVRRRVHALGDYERWRARPGRSGGGAAGRGRVSGESGDDPSLAPALSGGRFGGPRAAYARTPQHRRVRQWGGAISGGRTAAPLWLERETPGDESGAARHRAAQPYDGWLDLCPLSLADVHLSPLAKRDGIPKRRYAAAQPNQQWHIDFAETKLADGARVVVIVRIDDDSRFCVCRQVVPDMSSEAALQALRVVWQASAAGRGSSVTWPGLHAGARRELTPCGAPLRALGVYYRLITPYGRRPMAKPKPSSRFSSTNAPTTR